MKKKYKFIKLVHIKKFNNFNRKNNFLRIKNLITNKYFNFKEIINELQEKYKIKYYQKLNNIYYFDNYLFIVSYFVKDKYNNKNYYYIGVNLNNNNIQLIQINNQIFNYLFF